MSTGAEDARKRSLGCEVLHDGPEAFDRLLIRLLAASRSRSPDGRVDARSAYGSLPHLMARERDAELEPLKDAVREHLREHVPVSTKTRIFGIREKVARKVTLTMARDLLGADVRAIATTLIGVDAGIYEQRLSWTSVVSQRELKRMKRILLSTVKSSSLSSMLGCSRYCVQDLIARGIFKKIVSSGLATPLISSNGVAKVLSSLDSSGLTAMEPSDGTITTRTLIDVVCCSEADIIEALLKGRLKATGTLDGLPGLKALLFDRSEAVSVLSESGRHTPVGVVRRQQRWSGATVNLLRSAGMLSGIEGDRMLLTREVEAIARDYATALELKDLPYGPCSTHGIVALFDRIGLPPLFPRGDRVTIFWPRKAALEAMLNASGSRL